MDARASSGKIGELLVELELTKEGFHVERLDGSTKAMNGDLIGIRDHTKAVIQVKMNSSQPNRGSFGYAKRFLEDDVPFFNSKPGPILADFLVMVTSVDAPKFHVFPIKVAESIARELASSWAKTLKRDGEVRSTSFPVSPVFEEIKEFRDRWDLIV
ncbi:hypothetical protein [uncultured Maritalea sp.]|uniref:hypothetical protein n=1 Tax=uncultured Maritalea sp. TaxID=757249 RepID=UPI0026349753|nr:hypothetical protein [uncultured Maritalea sp.]